MSSPKPSSFHLIVEHRSRPEAESPTLSALKRLAVVLGKASSAPISAPHPRAEITERMGFPSPLPWARIWLCHAGITPYPEETCLIVEPVQMVAGMNNIAMRPLPRALTEAQLQAFIAILQPILAIDGAQCENVQGQCVLRIPRHLKISTTPLDEAGHRDLRDCLPSGEDSGWMRRAMTECQMVLHDLSSHPELASSGVNGVWLWGNTPHNADPFALNSHHHLKRDLRTHDRWLAALNVLADQSNPVPAQSRIWHGTPFDAEFEDVLTLKIRELWTGKLSTLSISLWQESAPGQIWHIKRHHLLRFWSQPVKIDG